MYSEPKPTNLHLVAQVPPIQNVNPSLRKTKSMTKKRKRKFQENLLVDFPLLWRDDKQTLIARM